MDFNEQVEEMSVECTAPTYGSIVKTIRLDSEEDYKRFMAKADEVWPPAAEGAKEVTSFSQLCTNTPNTQQLIADVIKAKEILGAGENVHVHGKVARAVKAIPYARQLPEYKGKSVYEIVESLKAEIPAGIAPAGIHPETLYSTEDLAVDKFVKMYGIEPLMDVGCTPACSWQSTAGAYTCKNLLKGDKQVGLATAEIFKLMSNEELAARFDVVYKRCTRSWLNQVDDVDGNIEAALVDVAPGILRDDLALIMKYAGSDCYMCEGGKVIDVRSTPYATCIVYGFDKPVKRFGKMCDYAVNVITANGIVHGFWVTTAANEESPSTAYLAYILPWFVRDDPAYFEALGLFTAEEDECIFSESFITQDKSGGWTIDPNWRERSKVLV